MRLILFLLLVPAAHAELPAGIDYSSRQWMSRDGDVFSAHFLEADPKKIRFEFVLGDDRLLGKEKTSDMAERLSAAAAVNGGFFTVNGAYKGEPDGFYFRKGTVLSEPVHQRAAFGICEEKGGSVPVIFWPQWSARFQVRNATIRLSGTNRERESGEVILYTPEFGDRTLTHSRGVELIVSKGIVVRVETSKGSAKIPPDGAVFSLDALGPILELAGVSPGDKVIFEDSLENHRASPWKHHRGCSYTSAGPALIRRGKPLKDYKAESWGFSPRFAAKRHPRTAVGVKKDGTLVFVIVDGRQPDVSVGMSLPELTQLLQSRGAVEAYNLDGGGSTTMVVDGEIVNSPSDRKGERPVGDAILLFPR